MHVPSFMVIVLIVAPPLYARLRRAVRIAIPPASQADQIKRASLVISPTVAWHALDQVHKPQRHDGYRVGAARLLIVRISYHQRPVPYSAASAALAPSCCGRN